MANKNEVLRYVISIDGGYQYQLDYCASTERELERLIKYVLEDTLSAYDTKIVNIDFLTNRAEVIYTLPGDTEIPITIYIATLRSINLV